MSYIILLTCVGPNTPDALLASADLAFNLFTLCLLVSDTGVGEWMYAGTTRTERTFRVSNEASSTCSSTVKLPHNLPRFNLKLAPHSAT
jgi:hypothetical protein